MTVVLWLQSRWAFKLLMKSAIISFFVLAVSASCYGQEEGAYRVVLDETGKHGPITFAVIIGKDGKIEDMSILKSNEVRGSKIGRKRFLKQFVGKSLKDPLRLRKDIDAITGATISSKAAVKAAKNALIIWKKRFIKKP
ncbi:MAG: FMN-binding protein [Candidatus Omnitrophota bacterium]